MGVLIMADPCERRARKRGELRSDIEVQTSVSQATEISGDFELQCKLPKLLDEDPRSDPISQVACDLSHNHGGQQSQKDLVIQQSTTRSRTFVVPSLIRERNKSSW